MPKARWATAPLAINPLDFLAALGPGQFTANRGTKCAECKCFIRKGDTAGFNEFDEIVCEECHS